MSVINQLENNYPQRVKIPAGVKELPRGKYMVYILALDENLIVVGHGKYNRAKVIFDDKNNITSGHIKAIFVRAYHLFGEGVFQRFIIECDDKKEAMLIEGDIHKSMGGNSRDLPDGVMAKLFQDFETGSLPCMVIRMALCSSFDGIADLTGWRRKGILADSV